MPSQRDHDIVAHGLVSAIMGGSTVGEAVEAVLPFVQGRGRFDLNELLRLATLDVKAKGYGRDRSIMVLESVVTAIEIIGRRTGAVDPRMGVRDNPDKIYTHWITFDPSKKNITWANEVFRRGERYAIARIYNHPNGIDAVLEVISPDTWNDLQLDVSSMSSPLYHASRRPAGLGNGLEVDRWEKIYGKIAAPRVKNGEIIPPR